MEIDVAIETANDVVLTLICIDIEDPDAGDLGPSGAILNSPAAIQQKKAVCIHDGYLRSRPAQVNRNEDGNDER